MELLRLLEPVREAARGEAWADCLAAFDRAAAYAAPGDAALAERVTSCRSVVAEAGSNATVEDVVELIEALEGVIVEGIDSSWAPRLDAARDRLGPRAAAEAGGRLDPAPPAGADAPLHGVANRIVLMDPTDLGELAELRDDLAACVDGWRGASRAHTDLMAALEKLDAVASNRRSRKASRRAAVDGVSAAVETAMHELEDAMAAAAVETSDTGYRSVILGPDCDPNLAADFVTEGLEYLDQAEAALLALESEPNDAESVNVTFRAFHTIKGVAAFMALDDVTSMAHHAETLLARVRSGTLAFTPAAADLFLRSTDVLRGLLTEIGVVAAGGTGAVPEGYGPLMELLTDPALPERLAAGTPLPSPAPPPTEDRSRPSAPATPMEGSEAASASTSPSGAVASPGVEESVRIPTERLDELVDMVGELVVAHSMIAQDPAVTASRGPLVRKVAAAHKILRDLQDLSTSLRMVPLRPAFQKVSRVVRDVSHRSGKPVELITDGDGTELDRSMVSVVTDPLVHMVRNAVDHGIESAEERLSAGKPAVGTVRLTAQQVGGTVVIEIEDDGRGLDRDALVAKAVERGLIGAERVLTDAEAFGLVFHPGLSTAKAVTDISGRGVGMDVVRRAVESMRGRIEIESTLGEGTRFSIRLPLTLAITDGMLVRVGSHRYIVPTQKIQLTVKATEDDLWSVAQKGEMVMLQDDLVPVVRLHELYSIEGAQEELTEGLLVLTGEGMRRTAFLVDELLGQQQFVVKALTGQVAGTPGVAGGAILGDGAVGLILDPEELIELARGDGSAVASRWDAA